jgi:hypothetical protein
MKTFDEIFALATSPLYREYAETFTDPRLSWGVGVTQGVAVAMQAAQAEIDRLTQQNAELLAALQVIVDSGGIGSEDMFDDAREAIAKARGES